jgi:putative membrane protein
MPEVAMTQITLLRSTAVVVAIGLAACSSRNDATTRDSAAGAVAPAPVVTDSTQPASQPAASAMTDANIIAKEKGGDSAEVAIGEFARTHASDAQVKAYAALLVHDHAKGEKEVVALAKKLAVTPQPPADDTTSQETAHTIAHLTALKGYDFDTAFVHHEIADHTTDIDDAHKAAAAAQNPEVKALVEKSLPELQKHLDRAQALDKKLSASKR